MSKRGGSRTSGVSRRRLLASLAVACPLAGAAAFAGATETSAAARRVKVVIRDLESVLLRSYRGAPAATVTSLDGLDDAAIEEARARLDAVIADPSLIDAMSAAIDGELDRGDTAMMDRWILSRTEADICVMLSLACDRISALTAAGEC